MFVMCIKKSPGGFLRGIVCYLRQELHPQLQFVLPLVLQFVPPIVVQPQLQPVCTVLSSHSAGGKSGRLKNSSQTLSANSSHGGTVQKP